MNWNSATGRKRVRATKAADKAVGDFESAAINADILAQAKHGRIALHLFPDSLADGFEVRERWHEGSLADRCARYCHVMVSSEYVSAFAMGTVNFSSTRLAPDIARAFRKNPMMANSMMLCRF